MAGRRLSPEERALWLRVAGTVRARAGITRSPPGLDGGVGGGTSSFNFPSTLGPNTKEPPPAPPRSRGGEKKDIPSNTLDGGWDRQIATGKVIPERTIDLHGCSADQAHARLLRGIDLAIADDVRVLLIVTGKAPRRDAARIDLPLRGIIRASIGDWLAASRHAGAIASVRGAHPRHGGAGALYLVLRRKRV